MAGEVLSYTTYRMFFGVLYIFASASLITHTHLRLLGILLHSPIPVLIVNFSYQLGWLILCVNLTGLNEAQISEKTLFLGECKSVSKRDKHFNWWAEESRWPSPMWVGIIQSIEGPKRKNRRRKNKFTFSLFELEHPFSLALGQWHSWFLVLGT